MARFKKQRFPKPPKPIASSRRSRLSSLLGRIFCRRNIIIISEHKTQHLPVHPALQLIGLSALLAFITWVAYSTGSYVTAQQVLEEKNRKLASTSQENERIGAEFALLRRDLSKLLKEGGKGELGEYAKMMTEQYHEDGSPVSLTGENVEYKGTAENAILARIEYLENKVRDLQETHDGMIADIRATTGGKIKELENIIARTGVKTGPLVRSAEIKAKRDEQAKERYQRTRQAGSEDDARGGPFVPSSTGDLLRERDTELYFNLKRMMVLNDVVSVMPLSRPIVGARMSSGFGTRLDPFNGRLARHTGLDFAGPTGTSVLAAVNGVVKDTGWQTGYGKAIDIEHGYGFSTKYGHLSAILVKPGQRVKKGDVIGRLGSTGRSTGPHLHYEVRYHNVPLNPKNFLTAAN